MKPFKSKLLLAGVLTGAVALGTACKTDAPAEREPTPPPESATGGAGTGGTGEDAAVREREPEVHEGTHDGATGGAGAIQEEQDTLAPEQDVGEDPARGGAGDPDGYIIIEEEPDARDVDPGRTGGAGGSGPVLEEGVYDEEMLPDEAGTGDEGPGTGTGTGTGGAGEEEPFIEEPGTGTGTGGAGTGGDALNEGGNPIEPLPDDTGLDEDEERF